MQNGYNESEVFILIAYTICIYTHTHTFYALTLFSQRVFQLSLVLHFSLLSSNSLTLLLTLSVYCIAYIAQLHVFYVQFYDVLWKDRDYFNYCEQEVLQLSAYSINRAIAFSLGFPFSIVASSVSWSFGDLHFHILTQKYFRCGICLALVIDCTN